MAHPRKRCARETRRIDVVANMAVDGTWKPLPKERGKRRGIGQPPLLEHMDANASKDVVPQRNAGDAMLPSPSYEAGSFIAKIGLASIQIT